MARYSSVFGVALGLAICGLSISPAPVMGEALSPDSPGVRVVLDGILSKSLTFDSDTYKSWGEEAAEKLKEGKVYTRMRGIDDGAGHSVAEGKMGEAVVLLPLSPAKTFDVLTDLEHYKDFFDAVTESHVYNETKAAGATHTYYYQEVSLPLVSDPLSYMKISARAEGDGSYFIWWNSEDPGILKAPNGEVIKNNLTINSGSWRILPAEGGTKSLVYYTLIQVPGFYVPDFAWEKGTTWVGIPTLMKEIEAAGKGK